MPRDEVLGQGQWAWSRVADATSWTGLTGAVWKLVGGLGGAIGRGPAGPGRWAWPGLGGCDPGGGRRPGRWPAQSQGPPHPLSLLQGCQGPSQRPAWCAVARCRPPVPASAAAPSAPPSCRAPPSYPSATSRAVACGPRDAEHRGRSDAPGHRGLQNVARSLENLHVDAGPCIQSYFSEPVHPHLGISYGAWAPGRLPAPQAHLHPGPLALHPTLCHVPTPPSQSAPLPWGRRTLPWVPLPRHPPHWRAPYPQRPLVHSLIQQKSGCAAPGSLHPSVSFQPSAKRGGEGAPALGHTPKSTAGSLSGPPGHPWAVQAAETGGG